MSLFYRNGPLQTRAIPRALLGAIILSLSLRQCNGLAEGVYGPLGGMSMYGEAPESLMDMMRMSSNYQQGLREVIPKFLDNRVEMTFADDSSEDMWDEDTMAFGTLDEVQQFMRREDGGREEMLMKDTHEQFLMDETALRDGVKGRNSYISDQDAASDMTSSATRERTQRLLGLLKKGHNYNKSIRNAQYLGGLGGVRGGGSAWGTDDVPEWSKTTSRRSREIWGGEQQEDEILGLEQSNCKVSMVQKEQNPRLREKVRYSGDQDDIYCLRNSSVKRRLLFDDMTVNNEKVEL